MRARSGERDYLGGNALLLEHTMSIRDVAMPGDGNVIVARVVQTRITITIDRNSDDAIAAAERVQILRRVKMIVDVYRVFQLART